MAPNESLEDRIRAIEDRLEIYNLIASHPPSADTAGNEHIAASWVEDGVFDRGENLSSPQGREHIANQVLSTRLRSTTGSRISPRCPMWRSTETARWSHPICRSSFRRRRAIPSRSRTTAAPGAFASIA
jgi:SnoaL-like protein